MSPRQDVASLRRARCRRTPNEDRGPLAGRGQIDSDRPQLAIAAAAGLDGPVPVRLVLMIPAVRVPMVQAPRRVRGQVRLLQQNVSDGPNFPRRVSHQQVRAVIASGQPRLDHVGHRRARRPRHERTPVPETNGEEGPPAPRRARRAPRHPPGAAGYRSHTAPTLTRPRDPPGPRSAGRRCRRPRGSGRTDAAG